MEHLPGYITLGLSALSIVGFLIYRTVTWKKLVPKETYRGVGIIYLEGALPWSGLRTAIDSMWDELTSDPAYSDKVAKYMDFWIEIVAYENPIKTRSIPQGYVWAKEGFPRNGFPAPEPTDEEEAADVAIIQGTRKVVRFLPVTKKHAVLVVRQTRRGDSKIDARLRRGTGPMLSAGHSALFHELAEHQVSRVRDGDLNVYHKKEDLKVLRKNIASRYHEKYREELA